MSPRDSESYGEIITYPRKYCILGGSTHKTSNAFRALSTLIFSAIASTISTDLVGAILLRMEACIGNLSNSGIIVEEQNCWHKPRTGQEQIQQVQRTTDRLVLREFVEDDWRVVLAYQSDPLYLRHYSWNARTELDVRGFIQMFLDQQVERPRRKFQFAITLQENGLLIGN